MKKHWTMFTTLLILSCFALTSFAQPEDMCAAKEDMRIIRQAHMAQKAETLAQALVLDDVQIANLNAFRANADAVKAEYEPLLEAARIELQTLAASIRTNLDNGAELSEAEQEALMEARQAMRTVGRDFKKALGGAVAGLGDIFSDEQKEIIRDTLRPERPEDAPEGEEAAPPPSNRQGAGHGPRHGGHQKGGPGKRGAAHAARILLSDAFLQAIQ